MSRAVSVSDSSIRVPPGQRTSRRGRSIVPLPKLHLVDVPAASGDPAQDRLDAGQQLPGRERLDHVVVGPQLQALDAVLLGSAGGEQDDRPGRVELRISHSTSSPSRRGRQDVEQDEVDAAAGSRR